MTNLNKNKLSAIEYSFIKYRTVLFVVAGLSVLANVFLAYKISQQDPSPQDIYQKYKYLSKRVFQEDPNDVIINFVPLRKAIRAYIEEEKNTVGVYFEYLPSGISVGANDREEVKLASLAKVPLAM